MRIAQPIGGKVVVITGAARGIGEALAVQLAGRGARVALVGLEPERLAQVAERCGPNAAWWECDVTDAAALQRVVDGITERFRRVDVLVANAGIAVGSPLRVSDPASFDRVIEVNLLGSVRTVRAFLPLLIASHGYYLQIASLAALIPAPMLTAYGASKAGVEAFALALRTEMTGAGLDVGVAYLSFTNTDMTRGVNGTGESAPGRLGRLHDLEAAVTRLVGGIEQRAPFVYGQGFIRAVRPLRGMLPSVVHVFGRKRAAAAERSLAQFGPEASLPVGAGGRADTQARRSRT
jgi:NAD(P)-dependent dehydrogenase (short-subunit alcohol dehydrogenase family)